MNQPVAAAVDFSDDSVWIVIPAFNEARRILNVIDGVLPLYKNIVVVDDGSRDDTYEVLRQRPVARLRHLFNCGQGAALQTGIQYALSRGAQAIVTFDADGQHQARDIAELLAPLREGAADVVLGSRFLGQAENIPWTRRLVLKLGVLFTRVVSRVPVTDTHNGIRAFTRRAAAALRIHENRMAHASEIIDQIRIHGWRLIEAPVTIRYTDDSLAKGQTSLAAVKITFSFLMGRMIR
ncbi:MAG: glycosyltransferase family 2 protein [Pirellulales bacterium]